jgi:hypothetical protein
MFRFTIRELILLTGIGARLLVGGSTTVKRIRLWRSAVCTEPV